VPASLKGARWQKVLRPESCAVRPESCAVRPESCAVRKVERGGFIYWDSDVESDLERS